MGSESEQEAFWRGSFGDEYSRRNSSMALKNANVWFFAQALRAAKRINSILEIGANVGMNLRALGELFPTASQYALEINHQAASILRQDLPNCQVLEQSAVGFIPDRTWDLVVSKGVLIHIAPERLGEVYESLYSATNNFILVAEYYNPSPQELGYRGHSERLFRRDFAGELLSSYSDLELVDYGFVYRGDPIAPQDDITWFLLGKQ